jgi:hypothetical protein
MVVDAKRKKVRLAKEHGYNNDKLETHLMQSVESFYHVW